MSLFDLDLLEAVRDDPVGELERPAARLLRLYMFGGEALRSPRLRKNSDVDPGPGLLPWVCRRYFGKDIISYWSWDGIATLVSPTAEASLRLCFDWLEEYNSAYPVPREQLEHEVKDRLVRYLGQARCRPALFFGEKNPDPWSVQAFLYGYRRACSAAGVAADPVFEALLDLGRELAGEAGLQVDADLSWARAVGFTRSHFTGNWDNWFPKLMGELEEKRGVSVPLIESTSTDPED